MQVCPCVRLRLWRQYGRDWHRLRNATPASLARAASTSTNTTSSYSYQNSPAANPLDLLDRTGKTLEAALAEQGTLSDKPPPRISFYKSSKIISTQRTKKTNEGPTREEQEAWHSIDWRFFVSGAHDGLPVERPTQLFNGQLHYLKKGHAPEHHRELTRRFNRWKESVAITWSMLQDKQLPYELDFDRDSMLWRILEQEQVYASTDEAWLAGEEGFARGRAERIGRLWNTLSQDEREVQWPQLLISTLRCYPEMIRDVFSATFATALAPTYVVEDALSYIVRSNESANLALKLTFDDIFSILSLAIEGGRLQAPLHLRQHTLYTLLRAAPTPHDVSKLFTLLHNHGQPFHLNTLTQFTNRLAKSPDHKTQAVEMVQLMVASHGLDINSVKGSALCTSILSSGWGRVLGSNAITPAAGVAKSETAKSQEPSESPSETRPTPAQLFEQLLGLGLEPNLITYSAIIRQLCSKGELASAQEVLQIMLNAQTGLDAYVYSILMNGAKTAGHYPLIRQVAEAAASNKILHPYLWNDFLQTIHLMAFSEARSDPAYKRPRMIPAFPLMLETYRKTFAVEPLHELLPFVSRMGGGTADVNGVNAGTENNGVGMGSSAPTRRRWEFAEELGPTLNLLPRLSPEEAIQPTGVTLSTMVLGYIQGMSNPYDVIEFYSHFHRLVKMGHPVAVAVVEETGSLVYDIVIMALCEYDGMLRVALDVVSDMLRDAAMGLDEQEALTSTKKSKRKSKKSAEQVEPIEPVAPVDIKPVEDILQAADAPAPADAAASLGVHSPPSVFTWSILLNGFMYHRHTMQGERVLKMMTKRGIEPNAVTWNTLISGYARLQFARKTGNALLRREMAGFEPNDFTFRAFSYLGDKATVIKYLERHRDAKKKAASRAAAAAALQSQSGHAAIARELRSLEEDVDEIKQTMLDELEEQ